MSLDLFNCQRSLITLSNEQLPLELIVMKNLNLIIVPLILIAFIEGAFRLSHSLMKGRNKINKDQIISDISTILIPTNHPKEGFKLLPEIDVIFKGHKLKSNSKGYRTKEFQTKKVKNKFRIIGIGDSVMMGWGVASPYLALLESKLKKCRDRDIEVINMAIAGQSAQQEYFVLKKAMKYGPDFILLNYVGNDWIDESQTREYYSFTSPSYALNFLIGTILNEAIPWDAKKYKEETISSLPQAYGKMSRTLGKTASLILMDSRYESEVSNHRETQELFHTYGFKTINLLSKWNKEVIGLSGHEAVKAKTEHNKKYLIPIDNHPNQHWHNEVAELLKDYFIKSVCH